MNDRPRRISRGWLLTAMLLATATATAAVAGPRTVTDPSAPRALPVDGPVQVSWTDPARFTEIVQSSNRWQAERGDWVEQLARYLRQRAQARLPAGDTLEVTITDIKRAGDFEPWRGPRMQDVRIVRDLYPPRIRLHYVLRGAEGQVLSEGEPTLTDLGFLHDSPGPASLSDPLRHEKALLDDWLRRLLPAR